ncbi:hypothetical protein [Paenibacillus xylanexedens]|uniref:hypothetical protein n=1 Tax=Paenibacillus xylanexedens TaxID=528191 RepID=UPI000F53E62F|nr:hypothetical protein [Paenibacillus xylanexedens]RPK31791.1 hypothetical protein EDO6_02418 [Paenibacillus xylanexedens]
MTARIFSCGESIDNYYKCIENSVVGFKKRFAQVGETVYFSVKFDKKKGLYCGAKGIVEKSIDFTPWDEAREYSYWYKIIDLQFCEPFSLKVLSSFENWSQRFTQLPKPIKDPEALKVLHETFIVNKSDELVYFLETDQVGMGHLSKSENPANPTDVDSIDITGTFRKVDFINETHKVRGLETLVNKNFHRLFSEEYPVKDTILIPANRVFKTSNKDANDNKVDGVSGIPDGLLIKFNHSKKNPIQIDILEYECYGSNKQRSVQKFTHLNGHIIPQLIRFASAFSIVTDIKIRDENINEWVLKILNFVEKNELSKVRQWLVSYNPDMPERSHDRTFEKLLIDAFRKSLRILLIIDELSSEQKETIKNIIGSFKLDDGNFIEFVGYAVQLVEKLEVHSNTSQYALTIQE